MQADIRVRGTLMDQAVFSTTPREPASGVLVMTIKPQLGFPVLVIVPIGTEPSAHIAASTKARLLRGGTEVEAHGSGLIPQSDHGYSRLRLLGVTDVIPQTPNHSEADHANH